MIDHDESESRSNNSFKWYPLLQHFATAVAPWTVIDHSLAGGDHCWPRLGLMAGCFWCELDFLDISNLAIISQLNVWGGGVFYKKKMWFGIWSNKMGIICKNVWNNKVISRWNINNGWVSRCWSLFFLSNSSWTTKTGDRAPWLNYGTWTEKLRIDELI